MANWRVNLNLSFEIDSDDIDGQIHLRSNRGGPRADLLTERIMLEQNYGRGFPDIMVRYEIMRRENQLFTLRTGAAVKSGSDGELILSGSEFRSDAVSLVAADVGRVILIPPGQTPPATRGHYLITARNGPNSVTLDGVLPVAGTGLDFEIFEPGEVLVTLIGR